MLRGENSNFLLKYFGCVSSGSCESFTEYSVKDGEQNASSECSISPLFLFYQLYNKVVIDSYICIFLFFLCNTKFILMVRYLFQRKVFSTFFGIDIFNVFSADIFTINQINSHETIMPIGYRYFSFYMDIENYQLR
jgi:hypothetical protein